MSQSFAEALSWVPKSRGLAVTLARAFDYAKDQSHRTVMLEHLLLALAADGDASVVLQACNIDLARLNGDITSYLAGVDEQLAPGESGDPAVSTDLLRILEYASAAAQQSRRREINGAIVLAAIVGDGRSPAASMLRAQGLTFEEAIKALQWANAAARGAAQEPPQSDPGSRPAAASSPQSVQPGHDNRQESPPPPGPESPRSAPASHDHGGHEGESQQRVNGATSQSTEELLAAARRRVGSGRGVGQQASPGTAAVSSSPAHAREHPLQEPVHQPYREPAHSTRSQPERPRDDEADTGSSNRQDVHAATPPASPPTPAPPPPAPAPAHYPAPAATAQQPGRSDEGHHSAPAAPYFEPYPGDPGPSLDWARQQAGGYHQPQPHHRPDANRAHPAPQRSHPPRQNPPHVHPMHPAPRYQPEPPRSMQAPWSEPPPQPYPPGPGQSVRPPAPARHAADPHRKGANPERVALTLSIGQLLEGIPRTMTAELPETVEVRIPKAEIMALSEGLQGAGAAYRHDLIVTKAMSVRLRAPDGGFWIETVSPETQWIENNLGFLSDDYASWRWTVTPQWHGKSRLQLIVSARTVGADGLAAETALPDQVIDLKVRTNYRRTAARWGGWLGAAVVGGFLATFGEGIWEMVRALLVQLGVV